MEELPKSRKERIENINNTKINYKISKGNQNSIRVSGRERKMKEQ